MRVEISTEPTSESIDGYRVSIEVPDSAGFDHDELVARAVETLQALRVNAAVPDQVEDTTPGIKYKPGPQFLNVRKMEPRFLGILRGPSMTAELLGNGHEIASVEEFAHKWVGNHPQAAGTDLLIVDVMEVRSVDSIDGAKIVGEM